MEREILHTRILEATDGLIVGENNKNIDELLTSDEKEQFIIDILELIPEDKVESVALFHSTYGQPINNSYMPPNLDRLVLRLSLIFEELTELAEAMGGRPKLGLHMMMQDKVSEWGMADKFAADYDIIEVADALADLEYVLNGTILEAGLRNKFDSIFAEVQASNMSKTCKTKEDAIISVEAYKMNDIETRYEQVGDVFVIFRKDDDKVLKGKDYFEPKIKELL